MFLKQRQAFMRQNINIMYYNFYKNLTLLPFVKEIWLFGSRARGDHEQKSDIDIVLVCPEATRADWSRVLEIIENADSLLKIDCLRFEELNEQSMLCHYIQKEKVILYKKEYTMQEKIDRQIVFLEDSIIKLEKIVIEPVSKSRAEIEASIQRFRFCLEMFWKTLSLILQSLGGKYTFAKEIFRAAYQGDLIDSEAEWVLMIEDCNEISLIYNECMADMVYKGIKFSYMGIVKRNFENIKNKFYEGTKSS